MKVLRLSNEAHATPAEELLLTLSNQAIFLSLSPHTTKVLGWTEADWVGKRFHAFVHPNDVGCIADRFDEILSGRTFSCDSIRCLAKDGQYVNWTLSFVPRVRSSTPHDVLVLGYPSTNAGKSNELRLDPVQALRLFTERQPGASSPTLKYEGLAKLLEAMLGNAPIGFALHDEALRFICLNETFSEFTGFSPAQQLGRTLRENSPLLGAIVEPLLEKVLARGMPVLDYELEIAGSVSNEAVRYAQISCYPVPYLHGGICGVATLAWDITDRKIAEEKMRKITEELERSNRALEEFSYITSHDLKEPLRTITSFITLLKHKYRGKLDEDAEEYIEFVVDGARRMNRLIERILEFSRAGVVKRSMAQVDCNEVLRTIASNLKVALEESAGTLTYEELPLVTGDELLLMQVFQNLVANAIKYRSRRPLEIRVSAKRETDAWLFSVTDNGIGVSRDQYLNIFRPFRKLHSPSEYTGSGLGLAICQKNVERHGGRIWITSQPDKGSVFSFTIPATSPGAA